jgi:hypothetical protein
MRCFQIFFLQRDESDQYDMGKIFLPINQLLRELTDQLTLFVTCFNFENGKNAKALSK